MGVSGRGVLSCLWRCPEGGLRLPEHAGVATADQRPPAHQMQQSQPSQLTPNMTLINQILVYLGDTSLEVWCYMQFYLVKVVIETVFFWANVVNWFYVS